MMNTSTTTILRVLTNTTYGLLMLFELFKKHIGTTKDNKRYNNIMQTQMYTISESDEE